MLSVVVLICSLTIAPQDCTSANAVATLRGGEANTPMSCGTELQAMLGRSAIKPDPEKEYAKIVCRRQTSVAENKS